jgi:hypothetical protein
MGLKTYVFLYSFVYIHYTQHIHILYMVTPNSDKRWVVYGNQADLNRWKKTYEKLNMKSQSDFLRYCANTVCKIVEDNRPLYLLIK